MGCTVHTVDLIAVETDGQYEISSRLHPQDAELGGNIGHGGPHRIQSHEGTRSEGAGEEPAHTLPHTWDIALRPRHTRHEEQGHGDEHHQQHHVLAILHHTRHHHAEEDAGDDKGRHQREQRCPCS